MTAQTGQPSLTVRKAEAAPVKAATEPTDRSIWPETMTSSIPSAMTMT